MSVENVVGFLEATARDEVLRRDLAGIVGVGDGDVSSAAQLDAAEAEALLGQRGVLVTTFADQQGYSFTVAELNAVVGTIQRHQNGELSEEELKSALGLSTAISDVAKESVGMVYRGVAYSKKSSEEAGEPSVVAFVKATGKDESLRQELKRILETGDGDISDFTQLDAGETEALQGERAARVAAFASAHGFQFTMADLFSVVDAFQRLKKGEMSEDAFAKFAEISGQSADFLPAIESVAEMTYKGVPYQKVVSSPGKGNSLQVVKFLEKSGVDENLQSKLRALIGGDGDISSPEALDAEEAAGLSGDRSLQIVALGAEEGFRFSVSDLNAVVGAFKLVDSGDLSLDACKRILGISEQPEEVVRKTAGLIYRGARMG